MAKFASKGATLEVDISTTLTPVLQLNSLSVSGIEAENTDVTTLDTVDVKEYLATGFVEGGTVDFEGFIDYADPGQKHLIDSVLTAANFPMDITVKFNGAGTVTLKAASGNFDISSANDDAIGISGSFKVTHVLSVAAPA